MAGGLPLLVIGVALGVVLLCLAAATVGRKLTRTVGERREARFTDELRPLLTRITIDEDPDVPLPQLRGRRREVFEVLATAHLAKVRGAGREALIKVATSRGEVHAAERRLRRPGVVGRMAAIAFLGRVGTTESRPALERLLRSHDPELRAAAVRALGQTGDPAVIPVLLDVMAAGRSVPFGVVAMSIVRIGPAGSTALRRGLLHDDPQARSLSAELLGLHGGIEALEPLIRCLLDDREAEVRIRAARALGRLGSFRAVPALIQSTAEDQPAPLRAVATRALGEVGDPSAVDTLTELIGDRHLVAGNAARALFSCGLRGRDVLERLAGAEPDEPGSPYARETLARAALDQRWASTPSAS